MNKQTLSNCHAILTYITLDLYTSLDHHLPLMWKNEEICSMDIAILLIVNRKKGKIKVDIIGADLTLAQIAKDNDDLEPEYYKITKDELSSLFKEGARISSEFVTEDEDSCEYIDSDEEIYNIIEEYNCKCEE